MTILFLLALLLVPFFTLADAQYMGNVGSGNETGSYTLEEALEIQKQRGESDQIIPEWIKINAWWWVNDNISESEFLHTIEYLINNQIIEISISEIENLPSIRTTYTLPDSRTTEYAGITGSFPDKHEGTLTLTIVNPDKSEDKITTFSRDGAFMTTMALTSESLIGNYQVFAEIKGVQLLVSSFDVKGVGSNKVPSWVKDQADWWAQNQISDGEFAKGIQYLVEQRIIEIDEKLDEIKKNGNENEYEVLPREWQTSGPFQIDRGEYAIGEKIFIKIEGLSLPERGQITVMRPLNVTHYSVYLIIPFDGADKEAFNYYVEPQLSKTRGLCSIDDVQGKWTLVFQGTNYPNLNFEIIDKVVPGTNVESVC